MSRDEASYLNNLAVDLENEQRPSIGPLTLLQHYGFATDLLDWTSDGLSAAFFAVIGDADVDGEVWWFDQVAFESAVESQWSARLKLVPPVKLDKIRSLPEDQYWISKVHLRSPFARARVQNGFFTIGHPPNVAHDQCIDQLVTDSRFPIPRGRIVIPASMKRRVLDILRARGIDATFLRLPWADNFVESLRKQTTS